MVQGKLLGHKDALELHKRKVQGLKLKGHVFIATEEDNLVEKTFIVK